MPEWKKFTKEMIEPLIIGGCILGGGGGGSMAWGRRVAELALELGSPTFISLDDLDDKDTIVTVSAVGAPAAVDQYVDPIDYVKALKLVQENTDGNVAAIMTNENGGKASINGLIQSAVTGIPIVDAACNGRAHPTGVMGSIKLNELENYPSVQAGVGGRPGQDARVEMLVKGTIQSCSTMIRKAAVQAGGLVAVARNPVTAAYAKEHAAIGAISHALKVGEAFLRGQSPEEKVGNVVNFLNGRVVAEGVIAGVELKTIDGFDLGEVHFSSAKNAYHLTFWNEYMTLDLNGERLSTFPDLIMSMSAKTGLPVTTAELREGDEVFFIAVPYNQLILGSGMLVKANYDVVEKVLDKKILPYIEPLFKEKVISHAE